MFRLESYITPLVMNYVDQYVKLKPEDFQLSLWGGAAVLNQLDLRLDAIEDALNLPIKLTTGHISELKIQVPWTKLGFDPVVITINTMECVLSLRNEDSKSDDGGSMSSSQVSATKLSSKKRRSRKKLQAADAPPGYIQSLLNRIVNNVNIVVENLILKFVEEDIVLSLNVKTLEIFSVNSEWKRAFADMSAPDFVLRRLMEFTDLTVCLDKRDKTDGKIHVYQDPLIYRCSLQTRIHTKFDNIHSKMPSTTKVHTMCETLNISLTDTQLPMFLRIVELMLAIYYGELSSPGSEKKTNPQQAADPEDNDGYHTAEEGNESADDEPHSRPPEEHGDEGWASWAWSYVPAVLPDGEMESSDDEGEPPPRPPPPIFDVSFFNKRATLVVKLSKYLRSGSLKSSSGKVIFEPLVELKTEGVALEILAKCLLFLDVHFGITSAVVSSVDHCVCGVSPSGQDCVLMTAGDADQSESGLNYLTGCLFDSSQHHGSIATYIFDVENHQERYKESWAIDRFGALWINYLWIEEPPPSNVTFQLGDTDTYKPDFVEEVSYMKFWFHQVTFNYSSNMRHRLDKVLNHAFDSNYEPYVKTREEIVDPNRPVPTARQIKDLEKFIPLKNLHLAILRSSINYFPANHPDVDVKQHRASKSKKRKAVPPTCSLKLKAERFDMQVTRPMYARKLVKLVSKIPEPSGNLIYHCQYHQSMKVMRLEVNMIRGQLPDDTDISDTHNEQAIMLPLSAAYYNNHLLMSMYWTQHDLEKSTVLYEIPEVTLAFSMPQAVSVCSMIDSWSSQQSKEKLLNTSLPQDAFNMTGTFPILDISFNRLEVKQSATNKLKAAYGNLGSVSISLITKDEDTDIETVCTLLQAPADTNLLPQKHLFTTATPIAMSSDDFMSVTYQIPKTAESQPESSAIPTVLLISLNGWTATADPTILKWLLYKEENLTISQEATPMRQKKAPVLIPSIVDSSMPSLQEPTVTDSETATMTGALSDSKLSKPRPVPDDSPDKAVELKSSDASWLDGLLDLHQLSKKLSVNVKINSGVILIPTKTLCTDDSQYNMTETWRQLSYSEQLADSLIICLPTISAESHNVTLKPPLEDLPISISNGSSGLPVRVEVEGFSIYTHINRVCYYLLKPVTCSSSITMTSQHHMTDNDEQGHLSSLSLNAHHQVAAVTCSVSKPQLETLSELVDIWLKLLPVLTSNMSLGGSSKSSNSKSASKSQHHKGTADIPDTAHSLPTFDDESIPAVTESNYSHKSLPAAGCTEPQTTPTIFLRTDGKISHVSFNVYFRHHGYKDECLTAVADEVTGCLDIYKDYIKLQSKIWAVELLHGYFDRRCEEFIPGHRHGILISSKQRIANLQTMSANAGGESDTFTEVDLSQMMKDKPRDGFMNLTYTRASSASLKRRLNRLSSDLATQSGEASTRSTRNRELAYITELCIDLTRSDVICYLPALTDALQIVMLDNFPSIEPLIEAFSKPPKEKSDISPPEGAAARLWFHSQTLPLLHFTLSETRFILPVESAHSLKHDVVILAVQGIELTPQADNPLSRLVIDNDLYKKNQSRMDLPGSLVENRQLQMDIVGLSLVVGVWSEMCLEERKSSMSSSENPAFEWNKMAKAAEMKVAKLYPVIDGVNMKIQLAPAIVYQKTLMCGHTMEVNARTDINLSITDVHIKLISCLVKEFTSVINETLAPFIKKKRKESISQLPQAPKVEETKSIAHYITMLTPIDLLMTSRGISISLIGSEGRQLLLHTIFSQPHTVICTKPGIERVEISCYDMKIMTGKPVKTANSDIVLAHHSLFGHAVLETKPGRPSLKTGIFPSLFTIKFTNFLQKPVITIVNERPVKVSLAVLAVEPWINDMKRMFLTTNATSGEVNRDTSKKTEDGKQNAPYNEKKTNSNETLMKWHHMLPVEQVSFRGSQIVVSLTCPSDKVIDVIIENTGGQLTLTPSLDAQQLDLALSLGFTDNQLWLTAAKHQVCLIGPASVDLDINSAVYRAHPPTSSLMLSASVIPIRLGNESIKLTSQCVQDLIALIPNKRERNTRNEKTTRAKSDKENTTQYTNTDYTDDLRTGNFKYLLDKDQALARSETVLFYSDRDYSTLTWSYPEPRVLTNIHINPIPFDYPADPNASFHYQNIQIECCLEYWDGLAHEFREYVAFSINEHSGTTVRLPSKMSEACVPSRTWRVIINYYIERYGEQSFESVFAMVSPAVLVAAMKVDSSYVPYLVPTYQLAVSVHQIRCEFINQYDTTSKGFHKKITPFILDSSEVREHEVFSLLVNDTEIEVDIWDNNGPIKFDLNTNVVARYTDYKHLVWKQFLNIPNIKLCGDLLEEEEKKILRLTMDGGNMEFVVSQGLINSLLLLQHAWTMNKEQTTRHHLLTGCYVLCNNTHADMFLQQVGCDESSIVCIEPGFAHSFCWSKYQPLRVKVSLQEWPNQWSDSMSLDTKRNQIVDLRTSSSDGTVHLFVNSDNITALHKLITISGAVTVCSRMSCTELDFRLGMTSGQQKHTKVSPGHPFGSFVVNTGKLTGLRIKESQSSSTYSHEIDLNGSTKSPIADISQPQIIKINGEGMGEVDACFRIHSRCYDNIIQYCVEITPMYCVTSYLPHNLMLNILPSIHTWLQGNSKTTELSRLNGAKIYQISLQLSESGTDLAVMLPLSVQKFSQLSYIENYADSLSALDICKQSLYITDDTASQTWPPSSQTKMLAGRFQPLSLTKSQHIITNSLTLADPLSGNVGLEVEWSQRWSGCNTLLMSIRPRCIFISKSQADLTLVYGNHFSVLQSGETIICPDALGKAFCVGSYAGERIFTSDIIQITDEDVSPRSFFLPDEAILFTESYTYANIVTMNAADNTVAKVLYLTVTSHNADGVRIITLHDRFTLHNTTKSPLVMSSVVAPISNIRVSNDQVYQYPRRLDSTHSLESVHLTADTISISGAAALFLAFSHDKSGWSYPVQVPMEASDRQLGIAIPASDHTTEHYVMSTHIVNGVTYIMISSSYTPSVVIHNLCPFAVAYGQTLTAKSDDVLEAMSLLSCPPTVESDHSVTYTFHTVTKRFPSHVNRTEYPRLRLSGIDSHFGIEMWSDDIDIFGTYPLKLVHIPEVGDVKVSLETSQHTKHIYIEHVERAEVSMKEVRNKAGDLAATATLHELDKASPSNDASTSHHQSMNDSAFSEHFSTPPVSPRREDNSQILSPRSLKARTRSDSSSSKSEERQKSSPLLISSDFLLNKISVILLDEVSQASSSQEFLRLVIDGALIHASRSTSEVKRRQPLDTLHITTHMLNINVYNQQCSSDKYDFPVIVSALKAASIDQSFNFQQRLSLVRGESLISLELDLESSSRCPLCLVAVRFSNKPICVEMEDTLLQDLLRKTDTFVTLVSILPDGRQGSQRDQLIPVRVLADHRSKSRPVLLRELTIGKCELLVSVHASIKVFLASDRAPVTLPPLTRLSLSTTPAQLATDLGFHYGTGALYSAGWVVGSLELLFNPTGIVRSFMAGFSDLVYLPYYGLQKGPGAFVTGVSQGMTSVVRNVTQGTLTSVTHFAQSLSRNMDRLSLDDSHSQRQDVIRRHRPQALSQGLRQGLSGLALSFLGAVAGLADQPLQGLWTEDASMTRRATGMVTGVGKGLLGVVTKPISGTAEFISLTGHGLMSTIGLSSSTLPLCETYNLQIDSLYDYSALKYRWRFPLLTLNHGRVICTIRAMSSVAAGDTDLVTLVLLPELVVVIDCKESFQQQAFALSEIDCLKHNEMDSVYLRLLLTGDQKYKSEPSKNPVVVLDKQDMEMSQKNRIEEYVDSTSGYHSQYSSVHREHSALLLHEYCVPPYDATFFLAMFNFTKSKLNRPAYKPSNQKGLVKEV